MAYLAVPGLGAGLQPAGTSPAGVGTSGQFSADLGAPTPTPVAVRSLDPSTPAYAVGADGLRFQAINQNEQRALLALGTRYGSVDADPTFGNPVFLLDRDDGKLDKHVVDGCRQALSRLEAEGAVRFDGAKVLAFSRGRLVFQANFTDLTTGQGFTPRIGT